MDIKRRIWCTTQLVRSAKDFVVESATVAFGVALLSMYLGEDRIALLNIDAYSVLTPFFLLLFTVSLFLYLKKHGLIKMPVVAGLFLLFGLGFMFMVPINATYSTQYVHHCQWTTVTTEWKSASSMLFGVGFDTFYCTLNCGCI